MNTAVNINDVIRVVEKFSVDKYGFELTIRRDENENRLDFFLRDPDSKCYLSGQLDEITDNNIIEMGNRMNHELLHHLKTSNQIAESKRQETKKLIDDHIRREAQQKAAAQSQQRQALQVAQQTRTSGVVRRTQLENQTRSDNLRSKRMEFVKNGKIRRRALRRFKSHNMKASALMLGGFYLHWSIGAVLMSYLSYSLIFYGND